MDPRYGPTPPWHDAALELRGPVVADVLDGLRGAVERPAPAGPPHPVPDAAAAARADAAAPEAAPGHAPRSAARPGPHAVQLLRTYGPKRPPFPFAPHGRAQHRPRLHEGVRPGALA